MGELIAAMGIIRNVFDKYAGEEGDKETLTKKELSKLLREQIGEELSSKEVDEFFDNLNEDGDSVISYQEYITFVAMLMSVLG
uniref:EF-hand domain-containing protein n=1 Tax=Gasterosteus aculeatus aculeatus TaxID=481459 RepID=A0AAQ4P971_GASAC